MLLTPEHDFRSGGFQVPAPKSGGDVQAAAGRCCVDRARVRRAGSRVLRLQAVEHAPATPAVTTSPTQISGAGAAGQTTDPC